MKTIIKYAAIDGKEFYSMDECVKHEGKLNYDENYSIDEIKTLKEENLWAFRQKYASQIEDAFNSVEKKTYDDLFRMSELNVDIPKEIKISFTLNLK